MKGSARRIKMARFRCNLKKLRELLDASTRERAEIIAAFDADNYKCLSDISKNYISGSFPLRPEQVTALRKYRKTVHLLAGRSRNKQKALLSLARGSFLAVFLTPVLARARTICRSSE